MNRICVFCGSSKGGSDVYADAARALAAHFVDQGIGLVYGGGKTGLMGIVADAMLKLNGEVIGVIPKGLVAREVAHTGLKDLRVVESMHERKAMMASLSDAFIAMPGGFGTFEEYCEVVTWTQLGIHNKPCGLLNVNGFYDPLLKMFSHAVSEGFIRSQHEGIILNDSTPDGLVNKFRAWQPIMTTKWLSKSES